MINVSQGTKIFLTFFIIFSFFSQYISWNEISRFSLTRSIIEKNTFDIDSFHTQTGDRVRFKGHYYTDKSPGLSFLATPIYASWKILFPTSYFENKAKENSDLEPLSYYVKEMEFTYNQNPSNFLLSSMFLVTVFTSSLFSALTVLLLYKISKHFTDDKKQIFLITFIYGLGTLAFPHALVFTSHAVETFFGFLSFYLLFKFKTVESKKRLLLLAGMCLGFGLTISYSALLLLAVCFIYLFSINRKKFIMIFLIGVVLGSLPLLAYNYSAFANPFEFIGRLEYIDTFSIPANLEKVYINPQSGFSSTLFNLRLKPTLIPIILQILIFPSKGLFFYYPVLVFSFIGLCYGYKKYKAEFIAILFLFILFLVIIPSQVLIWWGAFSGFGLRYMLLVIPFLMIPLLIVSRRINLKIVALAICFSIFANLLMLQYGEDTISRLGVNEYEERLKNFQILSNPLANHYFPLFVRNGPRSILFENLILNKEIDIRLTPHSCGLTPPILQKSKISLFSISPIGIVALKLPFLSLVPIIISVFLIWKKEILKDLKLLPSEKLIVFIELAVIFILLFISSSDFIYGENWHSPEFNDGKIDADRWMSQNSTIQIFNREQKLLKKIITFGIEPFNKARTLRIYLNGRPLYEDIIENKMLMKKEIDLVPGLNEIRFNSVEGCEIPTEIGLVDCDLRCLSFKIGDIQIINEEK